MIRWLVGWSLRSRFVLVALAVGLIALGITQLRSMPVDVLPEFAPPYVEIQTEALGLSAEEVEQLITVPMEQDLLIGVPWLASINSESSPGLSSIVLVFQPGTDLMRARQMVAERLTQAHALPQVSKPPTMLQPLSSTSRVMIVGLSSASVSPIDLSVLARWTIAPRLMGVPGVANVAIWGKRDWQLQIQVDPERMRANEVSIKEVLETAGNALWVSTLTFLEASTPGTGGFVETATQRIGVRHISPIIRPDELAQVPISDRKKADGTPLALHDVAEIVDSHQPLIGDAFVNGGSTGLLLVVQKFPGANTLEVTRGIEVAFAEMQPGLPGVAVDTTVYRPATYVEDSIQNVGRALVAGALLVVLALLVFYRAWRPALVSALALPLPLIAAALVLYVRGATMNVMILTGLLVAVGVVVGDAIVDVENLNRRLQQDHPTRRDRPLAAIILAVSAQLRGSFLFATLIVLAAAVPVLVIGGITGSFFQPLAVSYALAVLVSMLVATTVTPALALVLLSGDRDERRESPSIGWLRRGYERALDSTVHRPAIALAAVVGIALLAFATLPFLGESLLPSFRERYLVVHLTTVPGTSQPEMTRIAGLVAAELRTIPGLREIGAHVGRAVLGDQVVDVNSAELWVNLDSSADHDRTMAQVQSVVNGFPGVQHEVETYLGTLSRDVVAPPDNSVVVRVYGDADMVLAAQADAVQRSIAGVSGVSGTRIATPDQQLIVETEVNIAAAQRYGLKPGDVRRAAATLFSGITVGQLFEEQKVFDVVVWSTPATRHSVESVRDLLIDTPSGDHVRLGDVADVRVVPTTSIIRHEGAKRYFDVVASVAGRDVSAVGADVRERIRQLSFPLEYHAEVLGAYADQQATLARVLSLSAAALIAIILFLQAVLRSWRLAALAFLSLPAALAGGALAALATGGVVSIGSLAGLAAVAVIAVRNSILLITHYHDLWRREGDISGHELAVHGAGERLAPTAMSILATALAFAPALFLGDVPGLEVVRPMAVTIVGGLVTTTLLDLFLLPALYAGLDVGAEPELELSAVTLLPEPSAVNPRLPRAV